MGCGSSKGIIVSKNFSGIFHNYSTKDIEIRKICPSDYKSGFLEVSALVYNTSNESNNIDQKTFTDMINRINLSKHLMIIIVAEDLNATDPKRKIVGTGCMFVEPRMIHHGYSVGYINDLAVAENYCGRDIGKSIIYTLRDIGILSGCYKIVLDMNENNKEFNDAGFMQKDRLYSYYISNDDRQSLAQSIKIDTIKHKNNQILMSFHWEIQEQEQEYKKGRYVNAYL